MHAFVRNCLPVALLLASAPALAGPSGVYLPSAPTGPGGEDSIETAGGTRCRQSMNSNGAYLDVGASGTAASPVPEAARAYAYGGDSRDREATAYVRVTVPLGRRPERVDCTRLYRLEIERLQREVEMLRMAAE